MDILEQVIEIQPSSARRKEMTALMSLGCSWSQSRGQCNETAVSCGCTFVVDLGEKEVDGGRVKGCMSWEVTLTIAKDNGRGVSC